MEKSDKIYIAGHTGLVGSNLLKRLHDLGYDNLIYNLSDNLDLRNQYDTENFFVIHKPKYVFMCAALVGGIQANIDNAFKFLYDNTMIYANIINYCIKYNVKKAFYLGSSCMYPKDYKQPLKEEYLFKGEFEPTNEGFAIAKMAGLRMCMSANREFRPIFFNLIPNNMYGLGDNFDPNHSHVLQALVKKICDAHRYNKEEVIIWGDGKAQREFLFVDDLIDCMLFLVNKEIINEPLNVSSNECISIMDLAYKIKEIVGYKGNFVFDKTKPSGMKKKSLDTEKLNNLGWKSKYSLDYGLNKITKYYKDMKDG